MEKLTEYLERRKHKDFAAAIGVSPSYLSQLLSGLKRPSNRLMWKIEKASSGYVDLYAWGSK